MSAKTEKSLAHAFAAESKAAARNATFAKKAEMDGYPQIARLFRAVAEAESVHARRYLMLMRGKIGSTEENLETAFQNEIKANVEEYPKLIKTAAEEGKKSALNARFRGGKIRLFGKQWSNKKQISGISALSRLLTNIELFARHSFFTGRRIRNVFGIFAWTCLQPG